MHRTEPILVSERIQRRLLEAPLRARVYERVVRVPGIHLRRLVRELGLAMGTVEHHLRLLEKHGLVFHHKGARRKSYYARENVEPDDVRHLHALRNPLWRKILLDVLSEPDLGFGEIASRMRCTPSTTAYHLRRLVTMGLMRRTMVGRNAYYCLTEPERVQRLLDTYRPTYRNLGNEARGPQTPDPNFADLLQRIPVGRVVPAPRHRAPSTPTEPNIRVTVARA